MAKRKKSEGILGRIGEAATSAAEVVIDAGSKAIHAVGNVMPSGLSGKKAKTASRSTKKIAPKASPKVSKAPPKNAGTAPKRKAKATPKTAKLSPKKSKTTKSAKPAAKSSSKRRTSKTR